MKIFKILFLACVLAFTSTTVAAQNVGHVDIDLVLSKMPEVAQAKVELESYQKRLENKIASMEANLRQKYIDAQARAHEMSPVEVQNIENQLNQELQDLNKKKQDQAALFVEEYESTIYPIQKSIMNAIEAVAIENNVDYMLEVASGAAVYWDDTKHDYTNKVLAKLGL